MLDACMFLMKSYPCDTQITDRSAYLKVTTLAGTFFYERCTRSDEFLLDICKRNKPKSL